MYSLNKYKLFYMPDMLRALEPMPPTGLGPSTFILHRRKSADCYPVSAKSEETIVQAVAAGGKTEACFFFSVAKGKRCWLESRWPELDKLSGERSQEPCHIFFSKRMLEVSVARYGKDSWAH